MRALGVEPPRDLIGQVARQVGRLVREGQPPEVIERALELFSEKRHLGPSALPSLIPEAVAGPGTPAGGGVTDEELEAIAARHRAKEAGETRDD